MRANAWVIGAAVILLSAGGALAEEKLDPERPSTVVPLAMDKLDSYTTGMLISYIEQVQGVTDPAAQENAARVASFLSQTDPNWRVSASQAMAAARATAATRARTRLKKPATTAAATPEPTPTPTARTVTAAASPASTPSPVADPPTPTVVPTSGGTTVAVEDPPAFTTPTLTRTPPGSDWYNVAQVQMQEFWEADRDLPGAAPKGKIYDPKTGLLVSLDDHQSAVGMANAFSDELANTTSGAGAGTLKRIKDK